MARKQSEVRMRDVLGFFSVTTGLEFFPDPSKWWRNERIKKLIKMTEQVIADQARELGCAHVTAEGCKRTILRPSAANRFIAVRQWASRPRIAKSLRAA